MDPNRKHWNERHQKLHHALAKGDRDQAVALFLEQHAMVHSTRISSTGLWSFEEEVLQGMSEMQIRQIPAGGEHSIAWILFHIARIEDITMNMLIAGTSQVFSSSNWAGRMRASVLHSANKMDSQAILALSRNMDIKSLRSYRLAVARRTRQIVKNLKAGDFNRKIEPSRIHKVIAEGAVTPEATEIVTYWSKKTIAGLLLMPPTRHCFLHLNEALRIKQKVQRPSTR